MDAFIIMSRTACFVGLAIALMDTLYPSEKFNRQIRMIFALVFLISMAAPIVKGEVKFEQSGAFDAVSSYEVNSGYAENAAALAAKNGVRDGISSYLEENKIFAEEIQTSINISNNSSISINEIELHLADASQSEEAARLLKEAFGDETVIRIISSNEEAPVSGGTSVENLY